MLTKAQLHKPTFVLPALLVIYFLVMPADLEALVEPVTEVLLLAIAALTKVLAMSGVVSPWLYILLSVLIIAKTVTRIWGPKA